MTVKVTACHRMSPLSWPFVQSFRYALMQAIHAFIQLAMQASNKYGFMHGPHSSGILDSKKP